MIFGSKNSIAVIFAYTKGYRINPEGDVISPNGNKRYGGINKNTGYRNFTLTTKKSMKDPAVLWYWNDWNGGTCTFSRHIKGCYMDLLSAQFNSGPLSLEEIKTVLGNDFAVWGALSKKFKQTPEGLFFNERLEVEKNKRKAYSASRKKNLEGKKSDMDKDINPHMGVHMENENENVNYNLIVDSFNEICTKLSKVEKLTNSRKIKIKNRLTEIGSYDEIKTIFKIASQSPFLTGENKNNWKASFDWILENDKNWVKIKEGQYSPKPITQQLTR